jgi:hypothetical protein
MLIDGVSFLDGAVNENFVVPYSTEYDRLHPGTEPTMGEIIFQVDGNEPGLYIYTGTKWELAGTSSNFIEKLTFTGDVYNTDHSNVLRLSAIPNLVTGTYKSVAVDPTGRVTSGTNPTTLDGFGITDAVRSSMVPTGDATDTQLVLGKDSRLYDSRTPKAHTHLAIDISDFAPESTKIINNSLDLFKETIVTSINGQRGDVSIDVLSLELKEDKSNKGKPQGYASLDDTGRVPAEQLPTFVDDVLIFDNYDQFPDKPVSVGEVGKIYVDASTNKMWRWGLLPNETVKHYIPLITTPDNTPSNDVLLGGLNPLDSFIPTQKAVKTYVDAAALDLTDLVTTADQTNADNLAAAKTKIAEDLAAAKTDLTDKITTADQTNADNLAAAKTKIAEDLAAAKTDLTDKITTAAQTNAGDLAAAKTKIAEDLAAAKTDLTDKITTAAQTNADDLAAAKTALEGQIGTLTSTIGSSVVSSINGKIGVLTKIELADTNGIVDTSNKLLTALLPSFNGDVTSVADVITLNDINGLVAGKFDRVDVNSKGQVTSGVVFDVLPVSVRRRNGDVQNGKLQLNTVV